MVIDMRYKDRFLAWECVLALVFCAAQFTFGSAQSSEQDTAKETAVAKGSEEGLSLKATRKVEYSVNEGTWLSLDLSPDSKTIVFDLVGHIYMLSLDGGDAKEITSGLPFDSQPKFSPDGKQIVYVSDRSGRGQHLGLQLRWFQCEGSDLGCKHDVHFAILDPSMAVTSLSPA